MDIRDRRSLKSTAVQALSEANDPKKMILLHSGAMLLLSLVLTVVDYLLENAIAGTGGLSGMGTRSILSTVQSCLRLVQLIVLPFWQIGYTFVTLKFIRRERTEPYDLCVGFHRFLQVLRLMLMQTAVYLAVAFVATQAGTYLFLMTPWGQPLMELMMENMYSTDIDATYSAMETMMNESFVPMLCCSLVSFLVLATPFFYRLRMAQYILLEDPQMGALAAMLQSNRMMKGNMCALIKLDLSFWWFYVLDVLVSVICYADTLLTLAGVTLPVSADVAFFVSFGVYLVCQMALYWWRKNEVSTTYAAFYEALQQPRPQSQPKMQPVPKNQPWDY